MVRTVKKPSPAKKGSGRTASAKKKPVKSTKSTDKSAFWAKVSSDIRVADYGRKTGFLPPTLWGLFGGLATLLGFPAYGFWPGVIFGLVALVLGTAQRRIGWAMWSALVWGCVFFLPHIYWAKISVKSVAPWLALGLIQVFYVVAWAGLIAGSRRWTGSLWVRVPFFALTWAGVEQLRGCFPYTGFPWAYVAYSQVDSPLGRLAKLGGEVAVSGATMAVAVLLAAAFSLSSQQVGKRPRLIAGGVAVLIFLLPFTIPLPKAATSGKLGIAAIQGNVQSEQDFADPIMITNNHVAETEDALRNIGPQNKVDLLVWGENALSADPRQDPQNAQAVQNLQKLFKTPLLAGAVAYKDKYRYNDYLEFNTQGKAVESYTKQVPVPFGEYIPNRSFYAKLTKDVNQISVDMLPGHKPAVLSVPISRLGREVKIGTGICFEVAVDWVMRGAVKNGAEILVVPTNNTTFGYSGESDQQLQMLRFRAIEYGRSGVQVSTQGKSGIVLPDGTLVDYTQLFKPDYLYDMLPLRTGLTPAVTLAPILRWLAIAAVVAMLAMNLYVGIGRRRKS